MTGICDMCGCDLPPNRKRYCGEECYLRATKEYNREYGERRKSAGLCRFCGHKASPGKATCKPCRAAYLARSKAQAAERRRRGLCTRCGRERKPGSRYCYLCIDYMRAYRESRR